MPFFLINTNLNSAYMVICYNLLSISSYFIFHDLNIFSFCFCDKLFKFLNTVLHFHIHLESVCIRSTPMLSPQFHPYRSHHFPLLILSILCLSPSFWYPLSTSTAACLCMGSMLTEACLTSLNPYPWRKLIFPSSYRQQLLTPHQIGLGLDESLLIHDVIWAVLILWKSYIITEIPGCKVLMRTCIN